MQFINEFQSLFTLFDVPKYEVIVKISPNIKRFFKSKKHLTSQHNLKEDEQGSLIVKFEINNDLEILPFIKKWLPDIKIIEPEFLKQKLQKQLQGYIDSE